MISFVKQKIQSGLKRVLVEDSSAYSIAMGFAVGIWIGLLPIFGFQMIPAFFISLRLKVNKVAAISGVWITNPITFIPIYLAGYWFGTVLLPDNLVADIEIFRAFLKNPSLKESLALGGKTLFPLVLGSTIIATVAAVLSYYLVYALVKYRHKKKEMHILIEDD